MSPLSLAYDKADIWLIDRVDLFTEDQIKTYLSLLNNEEVERYHRFAFTKDKTLYLLARALLRCTLSLYHPTTAPSDWQFQSNEFGKPRIHSPGGLSTEFNLSHTQGCVALAVSGGSAVGIDVEITQRNNNLRGLANYCFTPREQQWIFQSCDDKEQRTRFFRLWTLKEAYVKAVGQGISMGLKNIEFEMSDNTISVNDLTQPKPASWHLQQWRVGESHWLAFATRTDKHSIETHCFRHTPMEGYHSIAL